MIDIAITRKLSGPGGQMSLQFNSKIDSGEFVCVYGPSGAGKTSVLRMLAGLLTPDDGHIVTDNTTWFDRAKKVDLKPQLRNIGMVFQEYSLFPNMTVRGNLEFALKKESSADIVDELLQLTELEQLQDQKPALLSGGQKQRVALARALIRRPRLLLLDEPLSALDSVMQAKLQDYILRVHQQFSLTTILVSHDVFEVVKMSKRVLILEEGTIKRDGPPREVLPRVMMY
ncbi:MAG TPA: ATP-binding cassette domain-containing protein [Cyclobacteriaceae bacterium]